MSDHEKLTLERAKALADALPCTTSAFLSRIKDDATGAEGIILITTYHDVQINALSVLQFIAGMLVDTSIISDDGAIHVDSTLNL